MRNPCVANGYNEKRDEILEDDPKLEKEYAIAVRRRNGGFIANITAAEDPGILVCGAGHMQNLPTWRDSGAIPKSSEFLGNSATDAAVVSYRKLQVNGITPFIAPIPLSLLRVPTGD